MMTQVASPLSSLTDVLKALFMAPLTLPTDLVCVMLFQLQARRKMQLKAAANFMKTSQKLSMPSSEAPTSLPQACTTRGLLTALLSLIARVGRKQLEYS